MYNPVYIKREQRASALHLIQYQTRLKNMQADFAICYMAIAACLFSAHNAIHSATLHDYMSVYIRGLAVQDLPHILALYNQEILTGFATWQLQTQNLLELAGYFEQLHRHGFPVLVAFDGELQQVAGFALYSEFRSIAGFYLSVEHSIFIAPNYHRQGVGAALLTALMAHARDLGKHCMIAAIDADNHASIALHLKFEFQAGGYLPEVGRKLGQWRDLKLMYKVL